MVREDRPRPERVLTPVPRLQSRLNQPRDLLVPQPAVTVAGVQFLFQSLGDPTTQRCIIAAFRLIRCLFLSLDRLELIRPERISQTEDHPVRAHRTGRRSRVTTAGAGLRLGGWTARRGTICRTVGCRCCLHGL
jgi:hypothetical protein